MDPQTTWEELLSAYAEGDYDRLEELALALGDWLKKGGFPPTVLGHPGLGLDFERALAQAGCDFAFEVVSNSWALCTTKGEMQ